LTVLCVAFVASAVGNAPAARAPQGLIPAAHDLSASTEAVLQNAIARLNRGKEGSEHGFQVLSDYLSAAIHKIRENVRNSKKTRTALRTANGQSEADMTEARTRVQRLSHLIVDLQKVIGAGFAEQSTETQRVLSAVRQTLKDSTKYLTGQHMTAFLEIASAPAAAHHDADPLEDAPHVPATDAQDIRQIKQKEQESIHAHREAKSAQQRYQQALLALKSAEQKEQLAQRHENETNLKRLLFLRRVAKKLIRTAHETQQANALAILATNDAIKRDGELVTIVKLLRGSLARSQAQKQGVYNAQLARAKKAFSAVKLGMRLSASDLAPAHDAAHQDAHPDAHQDAHHDAHPVAHHDAHHDAHHVAHPVAHHDAHHAGHAKPALAAVSASKVLKVVSRNINDPAHKVVEHIANIDGLQEGATVTIPVKTY